MYRTPTTSGASQNPATPPPSASTATVQDAAKTFIRRPNTKRRSLDNMDLYKKQQHNYAALPSEQLLQEIMKTFEDIPSKVHDYPHMRKDIKNFLEVQSDKGIRAIFELSRRLQSLEAAAPKTRTPNKTLSSDGEVNILNRLGEVEAKLTTRLTEIETSLKHGFVELNDGNNDRGSDMIDKIIDRIDETAIPNGKLTEEVKVIGQKQSLLQDLIGNIASDVVVTREKLEKVTTASGSDDQPTMRTYANVAAKPGRRPALHSLAVTLEGNLETADQVLARVKKAVDAKGTGLKINKVRKAKNSTVILGCDTEEEQNRIKERIESRGEGLIVAPMKNKDPLVVLKDVFLDSEDDEMVKALYAQNTEIFMGLPEEESQINIKYKKRTRNPKTTHVVIQVRPKVWQRMTEAGALYLDLQRVRVEDQSPLIQCTKCLTFGHGRKFCTESVDRCSHCGGPHLREKCADFAAGIEPQCCNCTHSKLQKADHNAFSAECPIRKKWDYLARTNTAYL